MAQLSGTVTEVMYNVGGGILIVAALYALLQLALNLFARQGFTKKDLQAAGLNREDRRAFLARRKQRQNTNRTPFRRSPKGRRHRTRK